MKFSSLAVCAPIKREITDCMANMILIHLTQSAITCTKLTTETLEQSTKYVKS